MGEVVRGADSSYVEGKPFDWLRFGADLDSIYIPEKERQAVVYVLHRYFTDGISQYIVLIHCKGKGDALEGIRTEPVQTFLHHYFKWSIEVSYKVSYITHPYSIAVLITNLSNKLLNL